jgi:hypothetical protein
MWGTSFGGGHALVLSSRLGARVKAIVAQVGGGMGGHLGGARQGDRGAGGGDHTLLFRFHLDTGGIRHPPGALIT